MLISSWWHSQFFSHRASWSFPQLAERSIFIVEWQCWQPFYPRSDSRIATGVYWKVQLICRDGCQTRNVGQMLNCYRPNIHCSSGRSPTNPAHHTMPWYSPPAPRCHPEKSHNLHFGWQETAHQNRNAAVDRCEHAERDQIGENGLWLMYSDWRETAIRKRQYSQIDRVSTLHRCHRLSQIIWCVLVRLERCRIHTQYALQCSQHTNAHRTGAIVSSSRKSNINASMYWSAWIKSESTHRRKLN